MNPQAIIAAIGKLNAQEATSVLTECLLNRLDIVPAVMSATWAAALGTDDPGVHTADVAEPALFRYKEDPGVFAADSVDQAAAVVDEATLAKILSSIVHAGRKSGDKAWDVAWSNHTQEYGAGRRDPRGHRPTFLR